MTEPGLLRVQPTRVLVAVHDSPASLRAARVAVGVAATARCALLVVSVVQDGRVARALARAATQPGGEERRLAAAESVLHHVVGLARSAGVEVEAQVLDGPPATGVLAAARSWHADLLVVGRNEAPEGTHGRLGDVALHVVEVSDVPVVVVP